NMSSSRRKDKGNAPASRNKGKEKAKKALVPTNPKDAIWIPYFANDYASSTTGVIDIDKKRYANVPKSKRKRMQTWNFLEDSTAHDFENAPLAPNSMIPLTKY
ncbi:hypothetical protein HAX54_022743, partial [Datura stramonium]|nr:hypothetical protein [Datura stramonium]